MQTVDVRRQCRGGRQGLGADSSLLAGASRALESICCFADRENVEKQDSDVAKAARLDLLVRYGFRFGRSGAHASRTLMLAELEALLHAAPESAAKNDFARQVVDANLLGKRTVKSRKLTVRHLTGLYGLDDRLCLFRVFRRLWLQDAHARPVLALTLALARDPLLRMSCPLVLSKQPDEPLDRWEVENVLNQAEPGRFSAASLKSFAQNINSSWTQAGFLRGRARKVRASPAVTPTNLAFALFLGYLEGLRAQRLFTGDRVRLISNLQDDLIVLAQSASRRGLLVFLNTGGVMEVRFPGYLTPEEERLLHE